METHQSTDREAFIRSITEQPEDNIRRLVFSDWLEENGEEDRSEFIRLQIEIAQTIADCGCANCVRDRSGGHFHNGPCSFGESFKRERSWIATNRKALREQYGFDAGLRRQGPIGDGFMEGLFDRGFVGSIRLTSEQFMQHAAELFAAHPITEVVLSDKVPWETNLGFSWWNTVSLVEDNNDIIEDGIFDLLDAFQTINSDFRRYPTRELALAALSRACVRYGRRLAGLPEEYQQ